MLERGTDGLYHPVIMDFGLARDTNESSGMTESGAVMGTAAFMSPEQARGQAKRLDRRSDVYSLEDSFDGKNAASIPQGGLAIAVVREWRALPTPRRALPFCEVGSETARILFSAFSETLSTMQKTWRSIGNHQVNIEDDLFFVRARGLITDADAEALLSGLNAVHAERGRVIVIVDASQGVSVGPAARRRMAQESRAYGMVVFGAGIVVRSLIILVNNALRLITGRNAPLLFCADEQEARRLANGLREEHAAQKRSQGAR